MRIKTRIVASAALVGSVALGGCGDLLEVENPNNVTEDAVQRLQGAAALVNGAEARGFAAVSQVWLPYLTVSDDLIWGDDGSRDAWGSLDEGQIADPLNEFIDAYFPTVAQARWMADEAVAQLEGHVANNPGDADLEALLARAQFNKGLVYLVIGETMDQFAFSDKDVEGEIIASADFPTQIFDPAIAAFTAAVGDAAIGLEAQAMLARAIQSKAIRAKVQPTPNTADPLVNDAAANAAAAAVIAAADADWKWNANYSAATITNTMASWVNSRREPLIAPSVLGLTDPVDAADSTAFQQVAAFNVASDDFTPLTLTSSRQMHLILAEAALAAGGSVEGGTFTDHINNLRALDGLTPYSGQIPEQEMLEYSRRANLALQGQRLADMYRFGVVDDLWLPNNTATTDPGTLIPISCVEIRANSQLDNSPC